MSKLKSPPELETDQIEDKESRFQGPVKWYSEKRGYGFIQIDDEEVFIHKSALIAFGIQKLQNDDIVTVSIEDSERGSIATKIYGLERPPIPDELLSDTLDDGEVMARVKFFSTHRGYGFIVADKEEEDTFIHFRVLERNGFATLEPDQKILVRLEDDERGRQVTTIRLYTGNDFPAWLEEDEDEDDDSYLPFD